MRTKLAALCALGGVVAGCGSSPSRVDGGGFDANVSFSDGGGRDAYVAPGTDAGNDAAMGLDGGVMTDGGVTTDGGAMADGGSDAGPGTDASSPTDPCEQIAAIRSRTGTFATALPVTGAVVTYVMPALPEGSTDPRGVFVQCPGDVGPALFVAVDPTTSSFASLPEVGDVVSFGVTSAADAASGASSTGDQHRVTGISDWTVTGSGSVAAQDVSSLDLPSSIDTYESELITITGEIAAVTAAGTGFTSFQITTDGYPTASASLRVRMPATLAASLSPAPSVGCTLAVGPTPLYRYTTAAQPSAWTSADVTVDCVTPTPTAGQVFITEVGSAFAGADTNREFVELYNPSTTTTYDLAGCTLSNAAGSAVTFASGSYIAPSGYFTVAGSASEITANAVLPTAMTLEDDDALTLTCGSSVVDLLDWAAGFASDGASAQLNRTYVTTTGATDNDTLTNWCASPAASTYGTMGALGTPGAANTVCSSVTSRDVFFSEYVEGSGNNKALEIFNGRATSLDLTTCLIRLYANGASTSSNVTLTGTLASGDAFVICNPTASGFACDQTSSTINFNGDDALALECDGTVLDVIGQIGTDPGTEWGSGLTSTLNHTLRRLCSVASGDTNGADAFDPAAQWDGFAIDTFGDLGTYSCP